MDAPPAAVTRWIRFACACGYIRESLDTGLRAESCKACRATVVGERFKLPEVPRES